MGRGVNTGALSPVGGIGEIRNRRLYCQRSRPVPKAVFRAGRGGQWVHYFVALVRESKGDHRGGGDEEMS